MTAALMRKESTNHINDFLINKPCLLLTQCKKNLGFAIGKKPPISMGLMQHSLLVKLGERKRKQLLFEDITTVKCNFYS
jgi:hypothetical protein